MNFSYKGRDAQGHIIESVLIAETKADAIVAIRESGITPLLITKKGGLSLSTSIVFARVKLSEKIMFAKNTAGMLRAGLPLSRALDVLRKQTTNQYLRSTITKLLINASAETN
jgi:type II secretory pathway component PulF